MIPLNEDEDLPNESELEKSIINLSESLGKNDIVSQIFLEELLAIILPKNNVKKS